MVMVKYKKNKTVNTTNNNGNNALIQQGTKIANVNNIS